jgi:polysaccharide biosynthesis PFTS motif protein
MNIFSLFLGCIKKIKRSRLRRMIRSYRVLKQSGQIDLIAKVKEALTEQKFSLSSKDFSPLLMGAGCSNGEIVVRQYLLIRIGGLRLNQALLYALGKSDGKVIFPLPKEWRTTISNYGFKVSNIRSAILWHLYIFGAWLYGLLQIIKVIFSGFKSLTQEPKKSKKYVYFANLSSGNLPHGVNDQNSYDIVSWYLQWSGQSKNVKAIHHSVTNSPNKVIDGIDLVFQAQILPALIGWKPVAKYTVWGVISSFIALMDCFRGRWWHALLLNQSAISAQVRFLSESKLACEYLFHNSGWIYRPLWTYEVEKKTSKITFYFYSTNCESFKSHNEYQPIPYGWKAMNWPRYLVWDKYQADFIRRSVEGKPNIVNVGPIWFQDANKKMPICKNIKIAVFDITPHRNSFYYTLGLAQEFYTPDIVNKFLEDIVLLANGNYSILWKRKRNVGASAHPLYRALASQLAMLENVILIDSEISAVKIIEQSDIVISIPFTSTALLARFMGRPTVYYDPKGITQKDDRAAHGIDIIIGRNELANWLKFQIKKKSTLV